MTLDEYQNSGQLQKDLEETNWGGYTPTPEEIEEDRLARAAEEAWKGDLWEQTRRVLEWEASKKITSDQWREQLGKSKYDEIGGWERGGLFLTASFFGVCDDCDQAVWAEIGYMKLSMNPDWSIDRFLRFTYSQYKQALGKYRDNAVSDTQQWYRNRYLGIRNTFESKGGPSPKPDAFGTWS